MKRIQIHALFWFGLAQLLCSNLAGASKVDLVTPSAVMVIALDAPRFEDHDFEKHGKIPLAIPNIRL